MDELGLIYEILDYSGTFVFALSGAIAARQQNLDLFGILALGFTAACGGGILRDVCIGALPPAGISLPGYLITSIAASIFVIADSELSFKIRKPVLLFDAIGLSLFTVTGASKSLSYGYDGQVAVLLGMTTAVGGGVIRDLLLNRVPVILQKEIYASAALVGATIVVVGNRLAWSPNLASILGFIICLGIRSMAIIFKWNLSLKKSKVRDG